MDTAMFLFRVYIGFRVIGFRFEELDKTVETTMFLFRVYIGSRVIGFRV